MANTTSKPQDDGTKHVRLTAKRWQRRVADTNPPEFEIYNQGDELDITEKEYNLLVNNPIRVGVEEVESNTQSTTTATSTTNSTTTAST